MPRKRQDEEEDVEEGGKFKVSLQPYQDGFIYDDFKFKFLTSAWGTGKSLALILAAMNESQSCHKNRGVIFRKEFEDLKDSTIKDFEQYTGIKVDSSRNAYVDGSIIMFRHLEEINNLQNMNLGWFGLEQGEELETDERFIFLMGRLRKKNTNRRGYVVSNAMGHNWIYKIKQAGLWENIREPYTMKILGRKKLDAHYSATTFDNLANLPPDFISSLDVVRERQPKTYARCVLNSSEELDTTDAIIQPEWVQSATRRSLPVNHPVKRIVSIDVARFGDDKTVFYFIENGIVRAKEVFEKKNNMEVCGLALLFARKNGANAFAVDEIGTGSGVADRLMELGYETIFVNSSRSSNNPLLYKNLRTEIYIYGAEQLREGKVEIPKDDEDLTDQLCWAKYREVKSNGIVLIEAKEDIKKRYGRSPDNADAFLNGLWALQYVTPYVALDSTSFKESVSMAKKFESLNGAESNDFLKAIRSVGE